MTGAARWGHRLEATRGDGTYASGLRASVLPGNFGGAVELHQPDSAALPVSGEQLTQGEGYLHAMREARWRPGAAQRARRRARPGRGTAP